MVSSYAVITVLSACLAACQSPQSPVETFNVALHGSVTAQYSCGSFGDEVKSGQRSKQEACIIVQFTKTYPVEILLLIFQNLAE